MTSTKSGDLMMDEYETHSHTGVYIASGLIILALVVIGLGLYFYFSSGSSKIAGNCSVKTAAAAKSNCHKASQTPATKSPQTKPKPAKPSHANPPQATPKSGSNAATKPNASSGGSPKSGPTASGSNQPSKQLSNTGPGDIIALFIGTTLLGSAGYEIYRRTSFKKS
ncbi:MAG: hypothetical protein ACREGA_02470 [Candidatus Saccharimonadales bacterium]